MRKPYMRLDSFTTQEGQNLFRNCHFFDGTLTYTTVDGDSKSYPNLNYGNNDLWDYWISYYGDRRIGFNLRIGPWSSDTEIDAEKTRVKNRVASIIDHFIKTNSYKYLTLVKSLDYLYDPISNYDMVEDKESINGEETFTHTPSEKASSIKITAPQVELSVGEDPDWVGVLEWESNQSSTTTETPNLTTNQQAQANGPKTEHYTTTYDDASTSRLESYDVQSGGTTTSETGTNSTTTHLTPTAEVNRNQSETYTDVKSREDDSYHLTRRGNIGVTSTQEMIEKEREVARFNIVKEFFEELNKEVLLSIWN